MGDNQNFRDAAALLFRECFEGVPAGKDYTWFVQGKEGILDALESTSASRASIKPSEHCASIAAHAYHILFALRGAGESIGMPGPEGTWESSWDKQTATPEEWEELINEIRSTYTQLLKWFESNEEWSDPEAVVGSLALLPHMAFHLGAIRQLMKLDLDGAR